MPDNARLILRLRNFENRTLRDITTRVKFFRDGNQTGDTRTVDFAAGRQVFDLEFDRGTYKCLVAARRYEARAFFFPVRTGGEPVEHELILPRRARAGWNARFVKWDELGAQYKPFKKLLAGSPRLDLKIKSSGKHVSIGSFTSETYDDDDQRDLREGKAGLLNMYAKLTEITAPGMNGRSWWAAMRELLVIQRDRVIGIADPKMAALVKKIAGQAAFFPFYGKAPAKLHPKNIKAGLKSAGINGQLEKLFSVKTK